MSGDVFGNGMLLSEHIRLVAAFDHRHVFLDPNPDSATSFVERRRLFDLPRSSWADYDQDLISEGGGIYPRSAKSIPVSPQVREVLGLGPNVDRLTPAELMRAILTAPVDLLWNGGIGTYVKASAETNAEVGDKANDAIRVDGRALRCRVVGEGGNLGFTQLGRIEAARGGVRINTDAIDNSAGVDTSDHEVNIKILLDQVVRDGDLTAKQRNGLLAEMTDEVGQLVLRDNYEQNILLGNARVQSHQMLTVHQRFIRALEARGELDRALEFLPTDAEIDARNVAGEGLSSPEFAVLLAYAKITLTDDLLDTALADEPFFGRVLREYFPTAVVRALRRDPRHPPAAPPDHHDGRRQRHGEPRRHLVRVPRERGDRRRSGRGRACLLGRPRGVRAAGVLGARRGARQPVPTVAQCALFLESRRLLDRATRWVLQSRGGRVDVEAEIARFQGEVARIAPMVPEMLVGVEKDRLHERAAELVAIGAPEDLALLSAAHLDVYGALDIVEVAQSTGADSEDVARIYFILSERYEVDRMLTRITRLPRDDRWSALARAALRSDLYGALVGMTRRVIESTRGISEPLARVESWEEQQAEGLARARATLDEISAGDQFDLATLSVALRTIRTLVQQGA